MVFPPHSTYRLQPLDVVLFSPLSKNYTNELNYFLQRSQGITRITKRDFFNNFWAALSSTMKPELIIKSFQATGVWPMEPDAVLKRFSNRTSGQDEDLEIGEHGEGDSWTQLRKILDAAVADKAKVEAKRLSQSIHSLRVNNDLLRTQNSDLQDDLNIKKKRKTKRTTLDLQQRQEYYGSVVFWSPRKLREARAREATKQDEAQREKLQKKEAREQKAAASFPKKQKAEEAKVERQQLKEQREMAKKAKAKAEELAAAWTLKKQQQDAATSQNSHDTLNKGKRKASHRAAKIPTKRRRFVGTGNRLDAAPVPPPPSPKTTRTR
jgi:hypothetical protein